MEKLSGVGLKWAKPKPGFVYTHLLITKYEKNLVWTSLTAKNCTTHQGF
jgi:hypothetical protein